VVRVDSGVLQGSQYQVCRSHGGSKANGAKVQLWDCNLGRTKVADQVGSGPNPQGPGSQQTVGLGVAEVLVFAGQPERRSDPGRGAYLQEK
jgi:hypothetical protein